MLVRHAMARDPRVTSPGTPCLELLREMRAHYLRHAPVVEDGRLVGVVSERDLVRALPRLVGEFEGEAGEVAAGVTVGEVMSHSVVTCGPNDPIDAAAREMQERRIGCLPVVADGVVVGIVTATDLLRGFTTYLDAEGARRATLMWSAEHDGAVPDLAELCGRHRVQLTALLTSDLDTGARVFLLRGVATEERFARLLEDCLAAGLLVLRDRAA